MADKNDAPRRIDADLIRKMADLLKELGLGEIEYGEDEWHVRIAKEPPPAAAVSYHSPHSSPLAHAPGSADSARFEEANPIANHPGVIVSPMVGVVYTSDEPKAAPFVKVGDTVKEGDILLLIEAMKVFNQIKAPRSGKVIRILVSSGMPVEFGEPLLIIE
ncbi:MAG: acetyl-CoA carboxylase, biotin carboxyl carrier protein [Rhodospirillales bacterium RIFCSPLOWO2_12_FULL_58_28]|nr:MAG: acetyl-CoA carboxylase, biotin carboxyl carrier protein [Rhodospirillales bacterium RIFCSPLOWO2_02_FULL_58_16]OHC78727.1 MAG: acetyl-CoA carboxylase, biotin carboxyl carrier protein [Rhodospirillales bacterium RIFCSPLOWO2_12_FULL_58_28]